METSRMAVDPDHIFFSQEYISPQFRRPRESESLVDAVELIRQGKLSAKDFPDMYVLELDKQLWTLDNRRLWVFRKARLPQVFVRVWHVYYPPEWQIPPCCLKMWNPNFFPSFKGPSFIPSTAVKQEHFDSPLEKAPVTAPVRKPHTATRFIPKRLIPAPLASAEVRVGDRVYVNVACERQSRNVFLGPFTVTRRVSRDARLDLPQDCYMRRTVNTNCMKKSLARDDILDVGWGAEDSETDEPSS